MIYKDSLQNFIAEEPAVAYSQICTRDGGHGRILIEISITSYNSFSHPIAYKYLSDSHDDAVIYQNLVNKELIKHGIKIIPGVISDVPVYGEKFIYA
jgi:hypothetical protein